MAGDDYIPPGVTLMRLKSGGKSVWCLHVEEPLTQWGGNVLHFSYIPLFYFIT